MQTAFDLERSRSYWRFVPSGEGKHDSEELASLPAGQLEQVWDRAFRSRFLRYPEEDAFAQLMAKRFAGKRVLSIGSGLGFHEIYYQSQGAQVTCSDIVATNLAVIRRIAEVKNLDSPVTLLATTHDDGYPGPFDVGFIYGSLMTMPAQMQADLVHKVKSTLRPEGSLVLMVYTWKFAASTCGWSAPEEFDPLRFARASDPSVGDEDCPWSDWHDDKKLRSLCGEEMAITHRQTWQHGLFAWYELQFGSVNRTARFFEAESTPGAAVLETLPATMLNAGAANITNDGGNLRVQTGPEPYAYALLSNIRRADARVNCVRVDLTLHDGGLSAGILDPLRQQFSNTVIAGEPGRQVLLLPIPEPAQDHQLVLSNHRTDGARSSRFEIHRVEYVRRPTVISWLHRAPLQ